MIKSNFPNNDIAANVVAKMTLESVLSVRKMPTGEQNCVFAVKTNEAEYVIRMTTEDHQHVVTSALYWQEKLIPLGVPVAKFIKSDQKGLYSEFPSLLMLRLPGDDLCNIYKGLTNDEKKSLSQEMIQIQSVTKRMPLSLGFGIASSYEQAFKFQSWYDFVVYNLKRYVTAIEMSKIYDAKKATRALSFAETLEYPLRLIEAKPFLWDASERNVLVFQGKISGVVDIDELCFGDHLLVLGLTSVALLSEGHDDLYVQYWAEGLQLDENGRNRLVLYQLFYCLAFMSKHATISANNATVSFDIERLATLFEACLLKVR